MLFFFLNNDFVLVMAVAPIVIGFFIYLYIQFIEIISYFVPK